MTKIYLLVFPIQVSTTLIVGMSVNNKDTNLFCLILELIFQPLFFFFLIVHQKMVYKTFLYSAAETMSG